MKISKAQAQGNRERVVAAASELFRARGFDDVPVGDLMKAAGFTHGGFYNHFASKNAPGKSCPAAALAGDIGRQPDALRGVFAEGLEGMIASVEAGLEGEGPARRARAVALVARMVGALMLSRAVPDDHPLANEMLDANLRAALAEVVGGDDAGA